MPFPTKAETEQSSPLVTFAEARAYLRVSRSTLYRLMDARQITGHKVGNTWRFYEHDLRACVERDDRPDIVTMSEPEFAAVIKKAKGC